MERREALIVLNLLGGIGPVRKKLLETEFGKVEDALTAGRVRLERIPGIGAKWAEVISQWESRCDLAAELKRIARAGVEILTEDDDDYPPLLREIHDPPICLYIYGNRKALKESRGAIAVVGSRHTTAYGVRMADALSSAAGYAGWPVVSGLARGIDTVAHEATLRAKGVTVAVVGSGLASLYPQENIGLAKRIAESGGAVITEFPMLFPPDRRAFPMRNRIISGMSQGTVVVEAGLQSGSLITANCALEQDRVVFAVPGPADVPQSRGCHALIKDGAKLVESFADIAEEFVLLPGLGRRAKDEKTDEKNTKSRPVELQLHGLELKLWALLNDGERYIDDMIAEMDEDASSVLASLLSLEMKHLVKQLPGKRVVRA